MHLYGAGFSQAVAVRANGAKVPFEVIHDGLLQASLPLVDPGRPVVLQVANRTGRSAKYALRTAPPARKVVVTARVRGPATTSGDLLVIFCDGKVVSEVVQPRGSTAVLLSPAFRPCVLQMFDAPPRDHCRLRGSRRAL